MEMQFTYTAYRDLLERLKKHGYRCISYDEIPQPEEKVVILRHDIDTDIAKAVQRQSWSKNAGYTALISCCLHPIFIMCFPKSQQKIYKKF